MFFANTDFAGHGKVGAPRHCCSEAQTSKAAPFSSGAFYFPHLEYSAFLRTFAESTK
jgi:hypothetical protein